MHNLLTGTLGSGIHSGQNGFIVYTNEFDNKPKLLLADIPIDSKSKNNCKPNSQIINIDISAILNTPISTETDKYFFKSMNMTDVSQKKLIKSNDEFELIDNHLKCTIKYQLLDGKTFNEEQYYLIAGNRTYKSTYQWCEEFCALVKCCLLYTSPSPRDRQKSRMPSSA